METLPAAPATSVQVAPRAPVASRVPDTWLKPGIFLGSLGPLVAVVWRALAGTLSANPIAQVENELGLTALVLLLASLACTPARRVFGWTWPVRVRRELGLLAFFYACLHFLVYTLIDQVLDLGLVVDDVVKRPFITIGFLAFLSLIPLALTSTPRSIRSMGFKRWQRLHALTYVAGVLAAIHFIWRVKLDISQPVAYALVLATLLGIRLAFYVAKRRAGPKREPAARA
jgi:methionine sulfoxide reductase heme-binding subunit